VSVHASAPPAWACLPAYPSCHASYATHCAVLLLRCAVLCCAVLCCAVLCCAVTERDLVVIRCVVSMNMQEVHRSLSKLLPRLPGPAAAALAPHLEALHNTAIDIGGSGGLGCRESLRQSCYSSRTTKVAKQ
jgi:hypothetical protein